MKQKQCPHYDSCGLLGHHFCKDTLKVSTTSLSNLREIELIDDMVTISWENL